MSYDSANSTVRQELRPGHLTGVASASMQKFHFFQAAILKKVHATVVTAGTNAAAAVDIYNGTASVGTIVFGTNTAGTVLHSGALDASVAANSYVELKGIANSATLVGAFSIEYQTAADAVAS